MDTPPTRVAVPDTDPTALITAGPPFEAPAFAPPEPAKSAEPPVSTGAKPSRLRVGIAGAAVAGVAATAGIGLSFAAGGAGSTGEITADPPVPTTPTSPDGATVPGAFGGDRARGHRGAAHTGTRTAPVSGVQPPSGAAGGGHAATGGS